MLTIVGSQWSTSASKRRCLFHLQDHATLVAAIGRIGDVQHHREIAACEVPGPAAAQIQRVEVTPALRIARANCSGSVATGVRGQPRCQPPSAERLARESFHASPAVTDSGWSQLRRMSPLSRKSSATRDQVNVPQPVNCSAMGIRARSARVRSLRNSVGTTRTRSGARSGSSANGSSSLSKYGATVVQCLV